MEPFLKKPMTETGIETRLVYGFLDAGKTTYIRDCIQNDFFHKYGKTLILCFEQGEEEYDLQALAEKRTEAEYYDGNEDIGSFCLRCIKAHQPDRIYVEMNAMIPELKEQFPSCMRVTYAITWIDWATLSLYFANFRQMINLMVAGSSQVTFRGCPSRELLEPYSRAFRLMNRNAVYLRQDPMGYHEKAFDIFLPFSLEEPEISINTETYLPLWLDALEHPEHYDGKRLCFKDPLELRNTEPRGYWSAGRVVMVCCMADLQFMAFELEEGEEMLTDGWAVFDAEARMVTGEYGVRRLKLKPGHIRHVPAPKELILDSTK